MAQRSIGIVGAGQLAQMLYEASLRPPLDAQIRVLASHSMDPAVLSGASFVLGAASVPKVLEQFFSGLDLVIFENEFFPQEFESFAQSKGLDQKPDFFRPSLQTLKTLRNKLSQKRLLKKLKIPSSEFIAWEKDDAFRFYDSCTQNFGKDFVLKWGLGGYDGKGVLVSPTKSQALDFLHFAEVHGYPVYAERKIAFASEWAVIACRKLGGELFFFPFVKSQQKNGICYEVLGEAEVFSAFQKHFDQIKKQIQALSEEIELVGSFGVEFFLDKQGKFWVNELAPRVHNSGHYTQDAFEMDQFQMHLKACLDGDLVTPKALYPYWGMLNLIGPEAARARPSKKPEAPLSKSLFLHWYGKKELRANRKMGHLNWVASSLTDAKKQRANAQEWVKNWEKEQENG